MHKLSKKKKTVKSGDSSGGRFLMMVAQKQQARDQFPPKDTEFRQVCHPV